MALCTLIMVVCGGLFCVGAMAPSPIAVKVTPSVGFEPLTIAYQVIIEPNPLNRGACITIDEAEGDGMFSNSCWSLDGDNERKTKFAMLERVPAGKYEVMVELVRADGSSFIARTRFESVAREDH